ncbi:hypothetical protein VNI00_013646 [Paramarasmius palmivorus]|uniref:Uncharacterized protein n=1 Tax=Paramarasmius palmivorus TaxID=297713 RepID=A0AAW0BWS6_9AGAR
MFDVKIRKDQPRWVTYRDWSRQHNSDIVYVNVFGEHMVILNSLKSTAELLEKRSGNYSDRPPMYMANDLMKWEWDFVRE